MNLIELDTERHTIKAGGKEAVLAPKEYKVFCLLARADEKALTRDEIIEAVSPGKKTDARTVDQYIGRIRRALGKDGASLLTVTNYGYRLINTAAPKANKPTGRIVGNIQIVPGPKPVTRFTVEFGGVPDVKLGRLVVLS